ncbi:MAG: cbb3-type cytochrome c oxidase subunit I [Alphaproteobacteria bacterium]|nr:cbb3-type cytochrome c oxidase subunit I [Alphaproteobacteria bacterium]
MRFSDFETVLTTPQARGELRGWAGLAIGSLAIAGIFAVLLAISRIPGIQNISLWPIDFFKKGLVIHVVFSFVVWFLAVMGALWQLSTLRLSKGQPALESWGKIGFILGWISCLFLFVPAFMDRGHASLNNYIPVIIDPLYYIGLLILAIGLTMTALRLLINVKQRTAELDTVSFAAMTSALIYLIALVCFILGWVFQLDEPFSEAFNEDLFWGGGHILQFANTTLLLSAWYILGALAFGHPLVTDRIHRTATLLLLFFALFGPMIYGAYETFSHEQNLAFTDLQYGLGPSAFLMAIAMLIGAKQESIAGLPWKDPAFLCLILSMLVFGLGGIFGFFVDGADTRTPSHYHAMIGGIGLTYMGLFYVLFLPLLKRDLRKGKPLYWQIYLYAFGQVLQCIGLYLAGSAGTARKAAGADQALDGMLAKVGMGLNGLGGLTAVIGGVMFIWMCSAALLRNQKDTKLT